MSEASTPPLTEATAMNPSTGPGAPLRLPLLPPPPPDATGGSTLRPVMHAGVLSGLASRAPVRDEQRSFVDYCLAAYPYSWTKSPTERIREFDGIRLYVLSLKERELTAAPSDIDRVNVASMNHILAICGGYMKVRFSGEELMLLMKLSKRLEEMFLIVESHYKSLSATQKKKKLQLQSPSPSTGAEGALSEEPAAPAVLDSDEQVQQFHVLGDQYTTALRELQHLVKKKQSEIIPREVFQEEGRTIADLVAAHDVSDKADVDGLGGLARPAWLDTLMIKYSRHSCRRQSDPRGDGEIVDPEKGGQNYPFCSPLNLGAFCAFLSCCLVGRIPVIAEEHRALIELLAASNDCTVRFNPVNESMDTMTSRLGEQPQEYWAQRLFNFLRGLPDLKGSIKDNKQLLHFDIHIYTSKSP